MKPYDSSLVSHLFLAKRENNPNRAHIIVNTRQAKHFPSDPVKSLENFETLARKAAQDGRAEKPTVVIAFAETATAIGAVVAGAFHDCFFVTTTREKLPDWATAITFEESHSHAKQHYLCVRDEDIFRRAAQVVLVDELAHTNADGSKNDKRYSDVLEVLAQGINVISTINVQHLESVAARVEEATGIAVRERIPDTVLRRADQVVNVDVTKEELRERLRQGKIYAPQQAERALSSFFTYENLSFLRELCLREASGDQVRKIEAQELLKPALAGYAVEAVMVALSSWPTDAESLIRRGVRMANQLGSPCYVVYVRRPQESPTRIDAGIQRQLQHNLQLATRLGAEVVQLEGVDIAETLVNFASERNVRHAIFGKSRLSPLRERLRGSFLLDFLYEAVGVDVHVANVTPKYIK